MRKLALSTTLALLAIAVAAFPAAGGGADSVNPGGIVVDDNNACPGTDFMSIQAAVTASPAGSKIQVCPGTYNEQVIDREAADDRRRRVRQPGRADREADGGRAQLHQPRERQPNRGDHPRPRDEERDDPGTDRRRLDERHHRLCADLRRDLLPECVRHDPQRCGAQHRALGGAFRLSERPGRLRPERHRVGGSREARPSRSTRTPSTTTRRTASRRTRTEPTSR